MENKVISSSLKGQREML